MQQPEIFISYAWGGESEKIVDTLYNTFINKNYNIIRDKVNLDYRGSITSFMDKIGQGKLVILVISDKYLRSENCMYEIVQVSKNGQFHDRIFPIVLSDANFYSPINQIKYVAYWEEKVAELNEAMRSIKNLAYLSKVQEQLVNYNEILNKVGDIIFVLKDMNTLTPDMHRDTDFEALFKAVDNKITIDNAPSIAVDNAPSIITPTNTNRKSDEPTQPMQSNLEIFKKECLDLIDELQYSELFEKIKNSGYNYTKPNLAQFKQQYTTGHTSFQFPDQLKVFVNGIKEK